MFGATVSPHSFGHRHGHGRGHHHRIQAPAVMLLAACPHPVEYKSSTGAWLTATALRKHRNGDVTIDIRGRVPGHKVRPVQQTQAPGTLAPAQTQASTGAFPFGFGAAPTSFGPVRAAFGKAFATGFGGARKPFANALKVPAASELMVPPLGKPVDRQASQLSMLVDRSGSMASMGNEVSGGCNAYLDGQRKTDSEDGNTTAVSFAVFDNVAERVRPAGPLSQQAPITNAEVAPRGGTALYDSIAAVIADTITQLHAVPTAPAHTAVFILTDGDENQSSVWTADRIREQIKLLEDQFGWVFYFAAANQDACVVGSGIGFGAGQCVTFGADASSMQQAFGSASAAFSRQRRGQSSEFTQQERSSCAPASNVQFASQVQFNTGSARPLGRGGRGGR